jgi:hypothetical protein
MPTAHMKSKMKSYMQEEEILRILNTMVQDTSFSTTPGYSSDTEKYPDNVIPFIAEKMEYLRKHPHVDPAHFLSNLRLMLKKR